MAGGHILDLPSYALNEIIKYLQPVDILNLFSCNELFIDKFSIDLPNNFLYECVNHVLRGVYERELTRESALVIISKHLKWNGSADKKKSASVLDHSLYNNTLLLVVRDQYIFLRVPKKLDHEHNVLFSKNNNNYDDNIIYCCENLVKIWYTNKMLSKLSLRAIRVDYDDETILTGDDSCCCCCTLYYDWWYKSIKIIPILKKTHLCLLLEGNRLLFLCAKIINDYAAAAAFSSGCGNSLLLETVRTLQFPHILIDDVSTYDITSDLTIIVVVGRRHTFIQLKVVCFIIMRFNRSDNNNDISGINSVASDLNNNNYSFEIRDMCPKYWYVSIKYKRLVFIYNRKIVVYDLSNNLTTLNDDSNLIISVSYDRDLIAVLPNGNNTFFVHTSCCRKKFDLLYIRDVGGNSDDGYNLANGRAKVVHLDLYLKLFKRIDARYDKLFYRSNRMDKTISTYDYGGGGGNILKKYSKLKNNYYVSSSSNRWLKITNVYENGISANVKRNLKNIRCVDFTGVQHYLRAYRLYNGMKIAITEPNTMKRSYRILFTYNDAIMNAANKAKPRKPGDTHHWSSKIYIPMY